MTLTVLHTSDWHLGRLLYGRSRDQEFEAFLEWLLETIRRQQVDVLLVAGDIFDSSTPTHQAQALYYRFLSAVSLTPCQHVVIIGGNHDSPTLLNAPQALLQALNVYVIGHALAPEEEVLVLRDAQQRPQLMVAAVPYLRERDVRHMRSGETLEEKAANYVQGVEAHYEQVAQAALACQQALDVEVPVIAMGHLFTAGGYTQSDDGVRDVIVGGLGHVRPQLFDQVFDYVALGHLHVPQAVGGRDWVRYSGSPLPMGFGEATQQKSVCLIQIVCSPPVQPDSRHPLEITLVPVPEFQRLRRIEGDWAHIETQLQAYKDEHTSIWLEIIYTGDEVIGELRARVNALIEGSQLEVLRLQNQLLMREILAPIQADKALPDLTPHEVFERRLESLQVTPDQRRDLISTYGEALQLLEQASTERASEP